MPTCADATRTVVFGARPSGLLGTVTISSIMITWMELEVLNTRCSHSVPIPASEILVFGAGVPPIETPFTDRSRKDELSASAGGLPTAVTSALTALAVTRPESRFRSWMVEDVSAEDCLWLLMPSAVSTTVPLIASPGTATSAPPFVLTTPPVPKHPSGRGNTLPSRTAPLSTFACAPYESPLSRPLNGPPSALWAKDTMTCVPALGPSVTTTWIPMTVRPALSELTWLACWLRITYPTPGSVIFVLGAGVAETGNPRTFRLTKTGPAALVLNAPVALSRLVVLSDVTASAVTRPLSALTDWMVVMLRLATPVSVAIDDALVSIVPVLSTPGTVTDGDVLVCVTPTVDVQPIVDSAERPDLTAPSTLTEVPYAVPSKPIFVPVAVAEAIAGVAWTSAPATNVALAASINPGIRRNIRAPPSRFPCLTRHRVRSLRPA